MKGIKRISIVLLVILVAVMSVVPLGRVNAQATDWMAQLEDEKSISALSIPGTHDSGALYSFADVFGKCQTLDIPQQLAIGVRFLDIRLQLVDDELQVVHNFVDQKTPFRKLLPELVTFLQEHPTEFLIVSFKEEAAPVRSGTPFAEALETMLGEYPEVISAARQLPRSVGEARGRLHIIARYSGGTMGVPCAEGWQSNTAFTLDGIYVQDHYKLAAVSEKLPDITEGFSVAAAMEHELVLNFASCYISPSFPPSYAGLTAQQINPWLMTQLTQTEGTLGVLVCDFITSGLAETIIRRNFQ